MTTKTRVVVLFGGRSGEHEISCATAASVLAAIDREKFEVAPVGISADGRWVRVPDDPELYELQGGHGATIQSGDTCMAWVPGMAHAMEAQVKNGELLRAADLGDVDVVFPLLHGPYGEDGTVQGLFEMANVPYVGCGVASSAISMDKHLAKTVMAAAGIDVGKWYSFHRREWNRDRDSVLKRVAALGDNVFVKPCRAGSSLGISHVTPGTDVVAAITEALRFDARVIVESATSGAEIECAVLGGHGDELPRTTVPGCIKVTGADFYDYDTKYVQHDAVELQIPAPLSEPLVERVRQVAAQAFEALQCEGLARVDFFVDDDGIVVNEVNTMPGFTPYSMFPALWANQGIGYKELLSELIEMALARPMGLR